MELEKEIKERLHNIERRLEQMQFEPVNSRPGWLNFLLAFVTVFILIVISVGVVSFLQGS
ncbi:hypothetical protein M0651_09495 [Paenibacillus sp. MBLB2552]|uniref:Uncharacterized protein n=1 Tax=Paenibacillus mellifer TaxID=2937794 RepID=A0A9X1XWP7_9BACL|nr:hypothetical protein [Paenibacillus mellifer]MCK8487405.1 hypothetical protein [Paenibacillus mellifer]